MVAGGGKIDLRTVKGGIGSVIAVTKKTSTSPHGLSNGPQTSAVSTWWRNVRVWKDSNYMAMIQQCTVKFYVCALAPCRELGIQAEISANLMSSVRVKKKNSPAAPLKSHGDSGDLVNPSF